MSHSVKMPIAIITSPAGATAALPQMQTILSPTSSKSNQTFQYRVEERRRTVFIKSDTPPSQWDAGTVQEIIKLADIQEGEAVHVQEQQQGRLSPPNSSRRTQSMTDKEYLIYEEEASPQQTRSEGEKDVRKSTYLRRPGPKSESALRGSVFMRSDSPSSNSSKRRSRPRILFYHKQDPHYGFTNFSAHPVMYEQKKYPTSEHLFQSFKFQGHRPGLAEHIRTCSERPSVAFSEARRFQPEARRDWLQVNIEMMDRAIFHKFMQHEDLKQELLSTGDAELVEDSDKDAFWGVGADGRGRNELGKALERLRDKLRAMKAC